MDKQQYIASLEVQRPDKKILDFPDIEISYDDDGWYYVTNAYSELLKTKDKDAALVTYRALYTLQVIETALTSTLNPSHNASVARSLLMVFQHLHDDDITIPHMSEVD